MIHPTYRRKEMDLADNSDNGDGPSFGQTIKNLRERRGMNLKEAAANSRIEGEKTDAVSQTGWLRIEDDTRMNPKLDTLKGIAKSLNCRIEIDPEGLFIEELDVPKTGVICTTCNREQEVGEEGWEVEHGLPYCPNHTSAVTG